MKKNNCPNLRTFSIKLVQISTLAGVLLSQSSHAFAQSPVVSPTTNANSPVSTNVNQANELQMTAIPPRLGEDFSLKAKPGQTIQTTVRVKNSSTQPQTFKSIVEDFIIGEDGKEPIPVQEETSSQWSLAKWMTITPPINTLQPNQSATINVLIEVPADALPGGRYAMIMHEPTVSDSLGSGASAGVSQRVGTLVYFLVEGDVHEEAYIRDVQAKGFFENGPIPFSFKIENRSDIHIRPNVEVEITNMLGQKSGSITLEPQNIFPYTERQYASQWTRQWGFGKYTATITANYGNSGKVVTGIFSFWLIPLKLILSIIFGLSTLIAAFVLFKKKMSNRSTQTKQEIETLKQKVKSLENEKLHSFKDENN